MKKLAIILVLVLAVASAQAILPAVVVGWLLEASGGSLLVYDVGLGTTGALAGVLWADCYFSMTSCHDSSTVQSGASSNSNYSQLPLEVKLGPSATRKNPDSTKFDNPAPGARDVTPKSTVASTSTPSGGSDPGSTTIHSSSTYADDTIYTFVNAQGNKVDYLKLHCMTSAGITCLTETPHAYGGQGWSMSNNGWDATASKYKFTYGRPTPNGCGVGYTLQQDGTCLLTNATVVQKPATTRCEVLWDASKGFQYDAANPNCAGVAAAISRSDGGLSVASSDGSKMDVIPNGDGWKVVKTGSDSSWKAVTTGPYDSSQGGYPIIGSSAGTGPSTNPSGSSGTGSGNAVCGASPLPPCAVQVDDSGIPDPPTTSTFAGVNDAISKIDTDYTSRISDKTNSDHNVKWATLFPDLFFGAPHAACQPLTINLSGIRYFGSSSLPGAMTFDFCSNPLVAMIRSVLTWLLYVGTIWYIWRRFLSSEVPNSEGS